MAVDLHAHSTASDGALSPAELVAQAAAAGVRTLALTDHDTFAGLDEATRAADALGVELIPGVEISVRHRPGTFHLLGYFSASAPRPLADRLQEMLARREDRARKILDRLDALGAPVEWDDVRARAQGAIGRPHIAEALVAAGHVPDRQTAFDRYLGNRAAAFEPSRGLDANEAIDLVRASGGAAVLAHPFSLALGRRQLTATIQRLAARGLAGIEVHRADHLPDQFRTLHALAGRHDLIPCGGSDFHRNGEWRNLGATGRPPLPPDTPARLSAHFHDNQPART